jgi:hypothetical protein
MNANDARELMLHAAPGDLQPAIRRLATASLHTRTERIPLDQPARLAAVIARLRDGWVTRVGKVGEHMLSNSRPFVTRIGVGLDPTTEGTVLQAQGIVDDAALTSLHVHFDGEQWLVVEMTEEPAGNECIVRTHRVASHETGTKHHEYRTYYTLQPAPGEPSSRTASCEGQLRSIHTLQPSPGEPDGLRSWQPVASRYAGTDRRLLEPTADDGVGVDQNESPEEATE